MESANVKPPSDDDAQLASLLRQHHSELPDDGFTARVLAALPPRVPHFVPWFERPAARNIVFSFAALSGLAFALSQGLSLDTFRALAPAVRQTAAEASISLADPALSTALLVAAGSVLYAMKHRLLRSL